jgi:tRNA threonylcarbamoyladenosine biosynthesis protein TsaE
MKMSYKEEELPKVASLVLSNTPKNDKGPTIIALSGPLGAGKTSLTQAIAQELGISEKIVSPTFVIAKWYKTSKGDFEEMVHIDAYRIDGEEELGPLGFSSLLEKKNTLIVLEWPERLPKTLSENHASLFILEHDGDIRKIEGPMSYEKRK